MKYVEWFNECIRERLPPSICKEAVFVKYVLFVWL